MEGELVSNPLERNLGFYDFGKYTMAPGDAEFAFDKIGDLWNEEIQAESNSDDEAEVESLEGSDSEQEEMKTDHTDPKPDNQKKARQRLKRKQTEDETKTAAKRAETDDDDEITTASFLKELWKDTQESADKMFIIQRPNEKNKHAPAIWHLVQVDPEETNNRRAKTVGEYHVKYYVRNVMDSEKRLVRNCRYWPLIR
jgi:hypothetical protein